MNIVGKNNIYNTLRTLSGGQNDLLLSGGILQFLRVETLQLALQILGHLGQILECWCWCCWGCHLQETQRERARDKIKFKRKQKQIAYFMYFSVTFANHNAMAQ